MNSGAKQKPIQHSKIISFLTPSLAAIVFISVFFSQTLITSGGLLQDCDTGYHIRAGEYIFNTLSIPKQDMFSFLSPPLPWIAHEWLPETIMAAVHKIFGLTGIVIFFSFLISIVYYFLFKVLQTRNDNLIVTSIVIILVIASSQMHWLARPHIFSMLFVLAWYYLLDANKYGNHRKILYLQIPLMFLWVNTHAGFIIGFILNGIYLFGNIFGIVYSSDPERNIIKKKAVNLGLTSAACLIVSLVNPYGYQILLFPFSLVSEKFIMNHIREYLSPDFHLLWTLPFEAFLLFTFAVFAISKERLNLVNLLLILLFLHMSLFSARYIPLYGIIAAPIVAKQLKQALAVSNGKFLNFIKKKGDAFSEIDASANNFALPAVALLVVILLSFSGRLTHSFDPEYKPVAASKFLEQEYIKGNMFNNDEFGDYIIYKNYPMYKVFIDGRNDMYGINLLKDYFKMINFESGWEKIPERYNITWIIYDSSSPLSRYLVQNKDWCLIYVDKVASIFLKNIPENQPLIRKYRIGKSAIDESG